MLEKEVIRFEKTVIVGIITQNQDEEKLTEYLDELEFLTFTAGGEVIKRFSQKMDKPNPKTFLGTGKIDEIHHYIKENEVSTVIFDDELSPAQQKNITRILECITGAGASARGPAGRVVTPHAGGILASALAADGKSVITGGDDGKVMRTTADGTSTLVAERGRKWIDVVAAGPGGAVAFASGRTVVAVDGTGKVHELERPRAALGLTFFPKGLRLAIAGYNGAGLWFPGTAAPVQELEWKGSHIAVTLSPDGANVVTSMQEMALHGWRLRDGQHMRMSGYPAKVKSMSWSAKGRYLATSGAGVSVLWPFFHKDGPMGQRPLELGGRQELVTRVACHPAEEIAALGYDDGMILLSRFSDREEVLLARPNGSPVSALSWSSNGLELAFGCESGAAGLIDLTR